MPAGGMDIAVSELDARRHDFKNQLAIIRGFAEILLAEAVTGDPRRSDFEAIRQAASAALDLLAEPVAPTRSAPSPLASDGREVAAAIPPASAAPSRARTVLVVEDSDGVRELTRKFLTRHGYTVLPASSASEALDLFERHAGVDLLLTDVVMPGGGGPELARQLLERRPGLRVIYMSGYAGDEISRHGPFPPDASFLHKPFTSEALYTVVRAALAV